MEVVLDSNVLFRTLISAGDILDLFFNDNLEILAPEKLKEEFLNNKEEMQEKSKLSESEFNELIFLIFERITWVPKQKYSAFISKAGQLLGEHSKDEDFIALCLAKSLKLWTYEELLFKIGFGVSTKQVSDNLK